MEQAKLTAAHLPCTLWRPSGVSSASRVPTVGVLNADSACGCSIVPDRKPPPISVPAMYEKGLVPLEASAARVVIIEEVVHASLHLASSSTSSKQGGASSGNAYLSCRSIPTLHGHCTELAIHFC